MMQLRQALWWWSSAIPLQHRDVLHTSLCEAGRGVRSMSLRGLRAKRRVRGSLKLRADSYHRGGAVAAEPQK